MEKWKGRSGRWSVPTFFLFMLLAFTACHQSVPAELFVMPDTVQFQSGDLVFRKGISNVSRAVNTLDRSGLYTHVGMVVWTQDGWRVLHAVPGERDSEEEADSVKLETFGTYFRRDRAEMGGVYRYPLSSEDTLRLRSRALNLYYGRHPLFDGAFETHDTTAFYCTELVCFLYQQVLDIDLSEGRRHNLPLFPDLIFCSDVFQNDKLEEVFSFER